MVNHRSLEDASEVAIAVRIDELCVRFLFQTIKF